MDQSLGDAMTMRAGDETSLGCIDQYELVHELGGGGFGCVYLAHDTVAGIDVAVKGLPPLVRQNKEELENIRKNFALVSRLHHPHIAAALVLHPVKSVDYADRATAEKLRVFEGDFLMVMEYAPGVTLSNWRKQFPRSRVPPEQVREIVRQLAQALDYAHAEEIIHRDVKPANVMVETKADGNLVVRVLDFGLAAEVRSSMGRVSQQVTDKSGTRPYMAPEQWLGKKQNAATDQYALAVLAYELLTGEVPFASVFETGDPVVMMNVVGRETPDLSSDLPRGIRNVFAKALAKEPPQRFASCRAFAEALTRGRARTPAAPRIWIAAFLFVLAALGAGGYLWQRHEAEQRRQAEEAARQAVLRQSEEKKRQEAERQAAIKAEQERQAEIVRKKKQDAERQRQENEKRIADEKAAQEAAKRKAEAAAVEEARRKADEQAALVDRSAVNPVMPTNSVHKVKTDAKPIVKPKPVEPIVKDVVSASELAGMDVSALTAGVSRKVDLGEGLCLEMIWCPPGLGNVQGFWLGKYEVTQAQWMRIMKTNPSKYGTSDPMHMPVDSVSLGDCQQFAAQLNAALGVKGFRLPTVTEWNYACVAGDLSFGASPENCHSRENSRKGPASVGSYKPNPWGFCDMLGNVGEWTPDDFRGRAVFQRDGKTVCGGWWGCRASECLPSSRYRANPNARNKFFGMRICFSQ